MPNRQIHLVVQRDSPPLNDGAGRVVRFRPRQPAPRGRSAGPTSDANESSPLEEFAKYERVAEGEHNCRMFVNVLAVAVTIGLMSIGLWVTSTFEEMQSNQDCYPSDAGGCPPIYVPHIRASQRTTPDQLL
jgi:hypothetical protein